MRLLGTSSHPLPKLSFDFGGKLYSVSIGPLRKDQWYLFTFGVWGTQLPFSKELRENSLRRPLSRDVGPSDPVTFTLKEIVGGVVEHFPLKGSDLNEYS